MGSLFSPPKVPTPEPVAPPPPESLPGESEEDKAKLRMSRKRELSRMAAQQPQDLYTSPTGLASTAANLGKKTLG